MRKAIPQLQLVCSRVEDLSQARQITGQKFRTIRQRNLEHAPTPFSRTGASKEETVPWGCASNQVHLLLTLSLFCRQIRQFVQCVQIGASRGRDDISIGAMP